MDIDSLLTIIKILAAAFLTSGAVLISCVTWIVIQAYRKTEHIEVKMAAEFAKFGIQLNALSSLVRDELHKIELRVTKLEEWRRATATNKGDD